MVSFLMKHSLFKKNTHSLIIFALTLICLMFVILSLKGYLFDNYSILDDQRNILISLKKYECHAYDKVFYSSPFYFLLFMGLSRIFTKAIIIKFLFLVTIPIFIIFSYNLSRICLGIKTKPLIHFFNVLILFSIYRELLLSGYQKSLAFAVFFGFLYFAKKNMKAFTIFTLIVIAFIYPPLYLLGLTYVILDNFFIFIRILKEGLRRESVRNYLKRSLHGLLPYVLIFSVAYTSYYFLTPRIFKVTDRIDLETESEWKIEPEIGKEILNTRSDFIISSKKHLGLVPKHLTDDIRIGIFGLIGGAKLWFILLTFLGLIIFFKKEKSIIPKFVLNLLVTSVLLYTLAFIFYDKLYFPNRYTIYTIPISIIFLISVNLLPVIDALIEKVLHLEKKKRRLMYFFFTSSAFIFFCIYFEKKKAPLKYPLFMNTLFSLLLISSLLSIFSLVILSKKRKINLKKINNFFTSYILIAILMLSFSSNTMSKPLKIEERGLISFLERLRSNVSICGYPEIMDTLQALTKTQIRVNLGQGRSHRDAYEFYHFLKVYYSPDLREVREYMIEKGFDYFIIQKNYFHPGLTESNNIFSFYPFLRSFEEKLKNVNKKKFVLLKPPRDIVEIETEMNIVISLEKLKKANIT